MIPRACALLTLVATAAPLAAEGPFAPQERPVLQVPRIAEAPRIDGELDDPAWKQAARASGFSEVRPGDRVQPLAETEVLVAYDDRHLYLAFVAHDDPRAVRAAHRDRDEIWQDDNVGIILDTYGTASWSYQIFANPYGAQGDIRATNRGEDSSFDLLFESRGRLTERGYQVEMAIPFSSLSFPRGAKQAWRATFWRNHPRASRHQYSWAAIERGNPCFECQLGVLEGIEDVKPGAPLWLLPAVTGSQAAGLADAADAGSGLGDARREADASLTVRYDFSSDFSGEATVNPDFSQVESDAAQVDVNSPFALQYPEKRPFFQQGTDVYQTWINAVYTRSFNDPSFAVKLTGRPAKTAFGALLAIDEHTPVLIPSRERSLLLQGGRSTSFVGRLRQSLKDEAFAGLLFTRRQFEDGGAGTAFGADALLKLGKHQRLELQALASHVDEADASPLNGGLAGFGFDGRTAAFDGERYWGTAGYASLERDARTWTFDVDYWWTSPTFRTPTGFVTRNDERRLIAFQGFNIYPTSGLATRWQVRMGANKLWTWAGEMFDENVWIGGSAQLKGQVYVEFAVGTEDEIYRGTRQTGKQYWEAYAETAFSKLLNFGGAAWGGDSTARFEDPPVVGRSLNFDTWARLRPTERLVIEPSWRYSRLRDRHTGAPFFEGSIWRARIKYQLGRALSARVIVQYDGFEHGLSVEPLLSYKLNAFTIFYAGSTAGWVDLDATRSPRHDPAGAARGFEPVSRQYFFKLQYLFRR